MLGRRACDLLVDGAPYGLDLRQLDRVPATELGDPVRQVLWVLRQVSGLDRLLERREDLAPQVHQLLDPWAVVDGCVPLVEADLVLLLVDHHRFREKQNEGREHQGGVHDRVEPAHLHGVAEDHPFVAVLPGHLVVRIRGAPEGRDLVVAVEPPIRRSVPSVQQGQVRGEARDHGGPHEGVRLRALLHRVDLAVVAVADIPAVIARVDHEGDELLHHHVRHVQGLRRETLLVAEVQVIAPGRFPPPLDVGLQHREVVGSEAFVEVVLASRLLALLRGWGLLERALDAQERSDACRWLDHPEGRGHEQELRDVRLHGDRGHGPAEHRQVAFPRQQA
mmetsp:Transcript_106376/g.307839  ORF Transcript_106376/g.307839 Transcript_106376/m.307839 type:complete len:335 (+) Transcript_106376:158-1162(+)